LSCLVVFGGPGERATQQRFAASTAQLWSVNHLFTLIPVLLVAYWNLLTITPVPRGTHPIHDRLHPITAIQNTPALRLERCS
jgi:predicted acyltransferase